VNPSYTVHRPVANEYLVRERDRRRLRELVHVVLVLAPVALALTAFTWTHLQVLDAGYRIAELEGRRHELDRRESRLRLEAAYLASPGLIERRARAELAMRPPELAQLVFPAADPEGGDP
jgi:cell division protein FtsL